MEGNILCVICSGDGGEAKQPCGGEGKRRFLLGMAVRDAGSIGTYATPTLQAVMCRTLCRRPPSDSPEPSLAFARRFVILLSDMSDMSDMSDVGCRNHTN